MAVRQQNNFDVLLISCGLSKRNFSTGTLPWRVWKSGLAAVRYCGPQSRVGAWCSQTQRGVFRHILCVCRIDRERLAGCLLSTLGMEETVPGSISKVNKKMSSIGKKK